MRNAGNKSPLNTVLKQTALNLVATILQSNDPALLNAASDRLRSLGSADLDILVPLTNIADQLASDRSTHMAARKAYFYVANQNISDYGLERRAVAGFIKLASAILDPVKRRDEFRYAANGTEKGSLIQEECLKRFVIEAEAISQPSARVKVYRTAFLLSLPHSPLGLEAFDGLLRSASQKTYIWGSLDALSATALLAPALSKAEERVVHSFTRTAERLPLRTNRLLAFQQSFRRGRKGDFLTEESFTKIIRYLPSARSPLERTDILITLLNTDKLDAGQREDAVANLMHNISGIKSVETRIDRLSHAIHFSKPDSARRSEIVSMLLSDAPRVEDPLGRAYAYAEAACYARPKTKQEHTALKALSATLPLISEVAYQISLLREIAGIDKIGHRLRDHAVQGLLMIGNKAADENGRRANLFAALYAKSGSVEETEANTRLASQFQPLACNRIPSGIEKVPADPRHNYSAASVPLSMIIKPTL